MARLRYTENDFFLLRNWKWSTNMPLGSLFRHTGQIVRLLPLFGGSLLAAKTFAKTFEETKFLSDELLTCLAEVRLQLNTGKTKIFTT